MSPQQTVNDNDVLILICLACFLGPAAAVIAFKKIRHAAITWAIEHHALTSPYLIGIPNSGGRGLDAAHLAILIGLLGMCGLIGTLVARAFLPSKD